MRASRSQVAVIIKRFVESGLHYDLRKFSTLKKFVPLEVKEFLENEVNQKKYCTLGIKRRCVLLKKLFGFECSVDFLRLYHKKLGLAWVTPDYKFSYSLRPELKIK